MRSVAVEPAVAPETVSEPSPVEAVYAFELPVRLAHWIVFLATAVLAVTGWWLARGETPETPFGVFSIATTRWVHVLSGWVMVAAMAMRVIWAFTGNEYASWREWIPTSRGRLREMGRVVGFYLLRTSRYPEPARAHNPLGGLSYAAVYVLLAFMLCSGIAIEAGAGSGWRAILASPVVWIGPPLLRFLHHVGMWLLAVFVVIHVAIATLVDAEMRGACYGAIFSGWRPRRGAASDPRVAGKEAP